MSSVEVFVRTVAKALVPEETLGFRFNSEDGCDSVRTGVKGDVGEFRRKVLQGMVYRCMCAILEELYLMDGSGETVAGKLGVFEKGLFHRIVDSGAGMMGR